MIMSETNNYIVGLLSVISNTTPSTSRYCHSRLSRYCPRHFKPLVIHLQPIDQEITPIYSRLHPGPNGHPRQRARHPNSQRHQRARPHEIDKEHHQRRRSPRTHAEFPLNELAYSFEVRRDGHGKCKSRRTDDVEEDGEARVDCGEGGLLSRCDRGQTRLLGENEPGRTDCNDAADVAHESVREQRRHAHFAQRFAIELLLVRESSPDGG
mmetsp:Transcript_8945/g.21727  ORF Transcript_8945/g.21727 Transcript_8945/m.21727 type:complete len:210 (-) Transcript_8945:351-980(-)